MAPARAGGSLPRLVESGARAIGKPLLPALPHLSLTYSNRHPGQSSRFLCEIIHIRLHAPLDYGAQDWLGVFLCEVIVFMLPCLLMVPCW